MTRYKIRYNRKECIGAGACAAMDPDNFEMAADGKADLKNGKEAGEGIWEKEVEGGEEVEEGAKACPVEAIKVKNLDTGEDIL